MDLLFSAIRSVDVSIYLFLNRYAGNWLLDRLVSQEENNNLFKGGLFLATYVFLWFRTGPERDKRRKAIIAILTGALLALVVSRTIANLTPFRVRPMFVSSIPQIPYSFPMQFNMEAWSSFPSDTAAYFSALAFGLAYSYRRYAVPLGLYTAGWICLPRMFLGMHYASDIVVGGAIGVAAVWVSLRSEWLRSGFAPRVLGFMDRAPAVFYAVSFLVCFEMGNLFEDVRSIGRGVFRTGLRGPYGEVVGAVLIAGAILGLAGVAVYLALRALNRHSLQNARESHRF